MAEIRLDGQALLSMDDVHNLFDQALELPDYYGWNLDALFDCLTEVSQDTTVQVLHTEALRSHLGRRGGALLSLLRRAAQENAHITLLEEG